jgi:gliding motility-associated-like protein
VTVTTPDGCVGDTSVTVKIKLVCGEFFVPTIFSPNGDGNNDEFKVYGKCIEELSFRVYDRWGEKVFESIDPSVGWDGYFKGKLMNSASFVYVVDVRFVDGRSETIKGNVSLVR